MYRKIIVFVMFAACGGPESDFVTAQGIKVFTLNDFPTQEMVESSCAATILALNGKGWKKLDGLELDVKEDVLVLKDGRKANGVYYGERIEIHKTNDCWARNAFVHELVHLFQWERNQVTDLLHEDPIWWGMYGIEQRAQNYAIMNECIETGPAFIDPETKKPIGGW